MYIVNVETFDEWRQQARTLLLRNIRPEQVHWEQHSQNAFTFGNTDNLSLLPIQHKNLSIPKTFIQLAKLIACYRSPERWSLLYSLAWRTLFEDRNIINMKIDAQVSQALKMRKAVGRDKHKMEAFIRFRRVNPEHYQYKKFFDKNDEYYIAWFEPDHYILPITANFFVKRFTNMSWSILTPDGCAHWNQKELTFTEGLHKSPDTEDTIESLWLTYYSHIFNPARVKLKAMQSEMPKKYWVNLPEAPLIKELTRNAGHQLDKMIENAPSQPWIKTEKSIFIQQKQKELQQHIANRED
jgi:DNA polymerase